VHQQGVKGIAYPASGIASAGSKSLIDGVLSCKADEERLTRPSLADFDFAISRLNAAASITVDLKAEH